MNESAERIESLFRFGIWNLKIWNLFFNKELFPAIRYNLLSAAADKRIFASIGARGVVSRRKLSFQRNKKKTLRLCVFARTNDNKEKPRFVSFSKASKA